MRVDFVFCASRRAHHRDGWGPSRLGQVDLGQVDAPSVDSTSGPGHCYTVNMHRLLFYTIQHLLGELELNSSNSMQFNLELNWLIQIQITNLILI